MCPKRFPLGRAHAAVPTDVTNMQQATSLSCQTPSPHASRSRSHHHHHHYHQHSSHNITEDRLPKNRHIRHNPDTTRHPPWAPSKCSTAADTHSAGRHPNWRVHPRTTEGTRVQARGRQGHVSTGYRVPQTVISVTARALDSNTPPKQPTTKYDPPRHARTTLPTPML